MAELCDIYKICFNQICTLTCLFFNANVRIIVPYLEDTSADMTFGKVIGELIKLVNKWYWLHIYIFIVQFKIPKLCIGVVIDIILESQLISNVNISNSRGCVEANFLIFISKNSRFYCYIY